MQQLRRNMNKYVSNIAFCVPKLSCVSLSSHDKDVVSISLSSLHG